MRGTTATVRHRAAGRENAAGAGYRSRGYNVSRWSALGVGGNGCDVSVL